ncbi:hypothetical protein DL93DRAFT_2170950 [Clavulina sp. PMI_390]|nr:hypothetical protein DL93DRAFT_2170950 [Clavulina sp. PMI_390]
MKLPHPSNSFGMLGQELSSDMDRVTQLQDAIEQLFTIMSESIKYLSTASSSVQVNPDIPITKKDPLSVDPEEFETNKQLMVEDLMAKAKAIGFLIDSLPVAESEEDQVARLKVLEGQLQEANDEYRRALERAKALHARISERLRIMLDGGGSA